MAKIQKVNAAVAAYINLWNQINNQRHILELKMINGVKLSDKQQQDLDNMPKEREEVICRLIDLTEMKKACQSALQHCNKSIGHLKLVFIHGMTVTDLICGECIYEYVDEIDD